MRIGIISLRIELNIFSFRKLEELKLANLPAVKNETNIIKELRKSLPKCEIILK